MAVFRLELVEERRIFGVADWKLQMTEYGENHCTALGQARPGSRRDVLRHVRVMYQTSDYTGDAAW